MDSHGGTLHNMPEDTRRSSRTDAGPLESTVGKKLQSLIISASSPVHENHRRNTTGLVGSHAWSDNDQVNKLWDKFSKPVENGTAPNGLPDPLTCKILSRCSRPLSAMW